VQLFSLAVFSCHKVEMADVYVTSYIPSETFTPEKIGSDDITLTSEWKHVDGMGPDDQVATGVTKMDITSNTAEGIVTYPAGRSISIYKIMSTSDMNEPVTSYSMIFNQEGGSMKCRRRPFSVRRSAVARSPFRKTARLRAAERAWTAGRRIGFTARSSLKSMGRIPRVNGCYVLGRKYRH
jgi:hypothetical protein